MFVCFSVQEIFESEDLDLEGAQWSGAIVNAVSSAASTVGNAIVNTAKAFGDVLTDGVKSAVAALASGIDYIKNFATNIWNSVRDLFNRIKDINISSLWSSIKNKAASLFNSVKNAISPLVVEISSKIGVVKNFLTGVGNKLTVCAFFPFGARCVCLLVIAVDLFSC